MITIAEWMSNKTILITGGAGFMGKVMVEKLLRTCPGLRTIYLIIRPRGGKTSEERWAEITKDKLFENLLTNSPDIIDEKVTVLDGDLSLINFGLSQETIEELKKRVDIIFHSAASVRFNDPLHKALLTNTRGTLEMCKLASDMSNLEVFVHVSTAYCHFNVKTDYYLEKIYEPCQDWKTLLKLIERDNPAVLNTISDKIIQDHPNTYTFTKSLSEKVVEEYSSKFPAVIARPSIVLGILVDPLPGWTDNLNGLMGVTTAVCKGVMRVLKANVPIALDCMPVDFAVNSFIMCGWDKATSENKGLSVYNCTDEDIMQTSIIDLTADGLDMNEKECTLDNDLWYPFFFTVRSDLFFRINFFFLNVLPAIFVDSILFLFKKKTRLMKITKKIYTAIQALSGFAMKQVKFDCKNNKALLDKLTQEEAERFCIKMPPHIKTPRQVKLIMHQGVKKYVLKEKIEDNEYHRMKLRRFYYLDRLVRGILISALFIIVYKLFA